MVATRSKLWYLQRFKLLDALSESQRQFLAQSARMFELKRGERVYVPGDPSDQIFLLKRGVVKIASPGSDHQEAVLAFLHPGDIFGELAVVDESPRDHLAEVHEDACLCALSRDLILRLARESPELGYRITKVMGSRVRQFRTRLEELLCTSATGRVAHALVDLAGEHGISDDRGIIIPFRLSQRDLANLVGLTRETVNVVLHDFRQRGLVEVEGKSIRLLDAEALRKIP